MGHSLLQTIRDFVCALLHLIAWFSLSFVAFGPLDNLMSHIWLHDGGAGFFGGNEHWLSQAAMAVVTIILDLIIVSAINRLANIPSLFKSHQSLIDVQQVPAVVFTLAIITRQQHLMGRLVNVANHFKSIGL